MSWREPSRRHCAPFPSPPDREASHPGPGGEGQPGELQPWQLAPMIRANAASSGRQRRSVAAATRIAHASVRPAHAAVHHAGCCRRIEARHAAFANLWSEQRKIRARHSHMHEGKAAGPDGISSTVARAAAHHLARLAAHLALKAACGLREPWHWTGGVMAPIYKKKGSTALRSSYRPVLVSDGIAKAVHAHWRAPLAAQLNRAARPTQCGGVAGRFTDTPAFS